MTRDQRPTGQPLEHLAMAEENLEVREGDPRVLTGEAFRPGALAALDRLDQRRVVAVGDDEDLA